MCIRDRSKAILEQVSQEPVSYTHLDVYKRQPIEWLKRVILTTYYYGLMVRKVVMIIVEMVLYYMLIKPVWTQKLHM